MASSYTATDAVAYERLMGRWSGALAEALIAFAGVEPGDRVLDVGCGTGSLAEALAARSEPAAITELTSRRLTSPMRCGGWPIRACRSSSATR